jgi:hypothetical protein
VVTAGYQGWPDFDDDELLAAAEGQFDALVTLDTNLIHQQNVSPRKLRVVIIDLHPVVPSHLETRLGKIRSALSMVKEESGVVVVREEGIDRLSP